MRPHPDPASVLQLAWGELRLPQLQMLVTEAITLLDKVEPEQLLGRNLSELETAFPENPILDALEACRAELREESGMPDSTAQRLSHGQLVCRHMADFPRWKASFREALEKYRGLAGIVLELGCHSTLREQDMPPAISSHLEALLGPAKLAVARKQ